MLPCQAAQPNRRQRRMFTAGASSQPIFRSSSPSPTMSERLGHGPERVGGHLEAGAPEAGATRVQLPAVSPRGLLGQSGLAPPGSGTAHQPIAGRWCPSRRPVATCREPSARAGGGLPIASRWGRGSSGNSLDRRPRDGLVRDRTPGGAREAGARTLPLQDPWDGRSVP